MQSHSRHLAVPSLDTSKKVHNCSILSSSKPQVTVSEGFYNRAMRSPLPHSKYQPTPALDLLWRSPLRPTSRALHSHLSHLKPQTNPSDLNETSSALQLSQTALDSPLPKFQTASSNPDLCSTSPSLKSNQRDSSSQLSHLKNQESSSFNNAWTSSLLGPNQRAFSSTLLESKSQKTSLERIWTSLMERNQRSLSSPVLGIKSQSNEYFQTSPSLETNQMSPDSRSPQKTVLVSSRNDLSLPLSNSNLRKPLLSHSIHQCQSLPLFQSKSPSTATLDPYFRTRSSPHFLSKFQDTAVPSDKSIATDQPSTPVKSNVSGHLSSSSKYCIKNISASALSYRLQSKSSFDFDANSESKKEILWTIDCSQPCIVKGGPVPDDVVNKIINSISKSTIQRDLCRQILFRRMRGKPNPRPGPRLSTTYMVCLACASCIKTQCEHLRGKKDPRCATLFVIPTPETTSEGKIEVKLVFILSIPETHLSSGLSFIMKGSQTDEVPDDNLEGMEKIQQIFPTSESDIIQDLNMKKKCLTVALENKVTNQQSPAVDWLFYVKKSSSQPQSQLPRPSSSSSSSSSSSASSPSSLASSSSSSSSSSSALPLSAVPSLHSIKPASSSCKLTKVLSYHRLPPGVSWLEFIRSRDHQPHLGKRNQNQSPFPPKKSVRHSTKSKRKKESNVLLKFLHTKFQNEKS
ncbi:casein kinase II subunit alpha'-interacting protein [Ochotona curzoniae]|uniref:casein kinase II subunit alpha'-interacting protein n=1 Tax=Ochotona curzoniae TaxID=130825 RepID=UPI001B347E4D|nr:casein kinase II subunit alpha'-interacting protein [Ochotona curzoniae]